MANFSDNLRAFLQQKGISIRALEQQIGCSNGVISRSISKGTDISSQWVSKIIETFPELNPSWLLLGKGEMLIGTDNTPSSSSVEDTTRPHDDIWHYIREKDMEISRLNKEVGRLEAKVELLEEQLREARVFPPATVHELEIPSPPVLQNR